MIQVSFSTMWLIGMCVIGTCIALQLFTSLSVWRHLNDAGLFKDELLKHKFSLGEMFAYIPGIIGFVICMGMMIGTRT